MDQDIEGCAAISAYIRAETNFPRAELRNSIGLSVSPSPHLQNKASRPPPSLSQSRDAVELKGCRAPFSVEPGYGNCIPIRFLVR